jgi:hypothetical protein
MSAFNSQFKANSAIEGEALYLGTADDKCLFENNANYNVSIIKIDLKIHDFQSTYNSGDKLGIDFKINGKTVNAEVRINIYENNVLIGNYSCLSGNGWTVNLPVGVYDAVCIVKNEGYELDPVKVALTISKASVKILTQSISTVYGLNNNLIITLNDNNAKPIEGAELNVNLNGVKTFKTNDKGQVVLPTKGLLPNSYSVSISFAGNNNYAKSTTSTSVTVLKATLKLSALKKTFKKKVKTKKYTVSLGNKNAKLKLTVKGKTYTATTNAKGKATFKITKLTRKGKFKATIKFAGDKYYNKITKIVQIKIK